MIYSVIRKADGVEVSRYAAMQVIEQEWPLGAFDHVEWTEETPPGAPYTGSWRITKLAFRNRFTQSEKVAIEIASLDVATAPMAQRQMAAALRAYQADVATATFIDLKRADTRAGVQALESYGLLPAGRATVILDTIPTAEELFNGD